MEYKPSEKRYETMEYKRCGRSGLLLPRMSLGLWQNFGGPKATDAAKKMIFRAFDLGITHFDLANNYGPPPGAAEENFGRILSRELKNYRDELVISSKAGYTMWPGPYGEMGSRKYLLASLDQSLRRMNLEDVGIFHSHRFDPDTPLEETMGALASAIHQGKALYVGISSYSAKKTKEAAAILKNMGIKPLIHQPSYSMLNRWIEPELLHVLETEGMGCIVFSPLAQGMLTDKYINGIPTGSRASRKDSMIKREFLSEENLNKISDLNEIAQRRGQSLAQMALAWCLRKPQITSVLMGASSVSQIEENMGALQNLKFNEEELKEIDLYATESNINRWAKSSNA